MKTTGRDYINVFVKYKTCSGLADNHTITKQQGSRLQVSLFEKICFAVIHYCVGNVISARSHRLLYSFSSDVDTHPQRYAMVDIATLKFLHRNCKRSKNFETVHFEVVSALDMLHA